jgi:hypothetical protein
MTICRSGVAALGLSLMAATACEKPANYAEPPADSFEAISVPIEHDGKTDTVSGARVGPTFFQSAGAAPLLGRAFQLTDFGGTPGVAMIGETLWRGSLNGDRAWIGRQLKIDGIPLNVVGIMPKSFNAPPGAGIWIPRGGTVAK